MQGNNTEKGENTDISVKFSKPMHVVERPSNDSKEVHVIELEITDDILNLLDNPKPPFLEVVKRKFPNIKFSQEKFNYLFNSTEIQLADAKFREDMQNLLETMRQYGFAGGENGTNRKIVDDNLWVSFSRPQELMLFLDDHFDRKYPDLPLKFIRNSKILINFSDSESSKLLKEDLKAAKIKYHHDAAFFDYLVPDNKGYLIVPEDCLGDEYTLRYPKEEADNYNTYGFVDKSSFFKYAPMTKVEHTRFAVPEATKLAEPDVKWSWENNVEALRNFFEKYVANFKDKPFSFEPWDKGQESFHTDHTDIFKRIPDDKEIKLPLIEFDLDDKVLSLQANKHSVDMTYEEKLESIVHKFVNFADVSLKPDPKIDGIIGSMSYEIEDGKQKKFTLDKFFAHISNFGLLGGDNKYAKVCVHSTTNWSIQQIYAAAAMIAFKNLQYRLCPISKKMIILEDGVESFEQCINKLTKYQIIYKPVTFRIDLTLSKDEFIKQLNQFGSMGVGYNKSFEKKPSEDPEVSQVNKKALKAFFAQNFLYSDPMHQFVDKFDEKNYICVPIKNFSIDSRVLALADGKDMKEKCKKAVVKLLKHLGVEISEDSLQQGKPEMAELGKGFATIFCPIEHKRAVEVKAVLSAFGLHAYVLEEEDALSKDNGLLFDMQSQFMAILENVIREGVRADPQDHDLLQQPITHRFIGDVIEFFDDYKKDDERGLRVLDKFFSYLKAQGLDEKHCSMHFDCAQESEDFQFQLYLHQFASNLYQEESLEPQQPGYQDSNELMRFKSDFVGNVS